MGSPDMAHGGPEGAARAHHRRSVRWWRVSYEGLANTPAPRRSPSEPRRPPQKIPEFVAISNQQGNEGATVRRYPHLTPDRVAASFLTGRPFPLSPDIARDSGAKS